jgi:hypothetical protein
MGTILYIHNSLYQADLAGGLSLIMAKYAGFYGFIVIF